MELLKLNFQIIVSLKTMLVKYKSETEDLLTALVITLKTMLVKYKLKINE